MVFCGWNPLSNGEEDDDLLEAVHDEDASRLSSIGSAAYEVLRTRHAGQHNKLWNVSSGEFIELHATPRHSFSQTRDPVDNHDDWFPAKMQEIMSRTEQWCDILSLSPPDGLFLQCFREGLATLCEKAKNGEKKIIVRMMFGNIVGMPVNCNAVLKSLTRGLPANPNIQLWVGAWRKGVSWNHAKLIAVDGIYLHTGGHNCWDQHYLKKQPVHDLSVELQGQVAHDGHLFANDQWRFVESIQTTCLGSIIENLPDNMLIVARSRVAVSEFPKGQATEFPPYYKKSLVTKREPGPNEVPIITMGRYGTVLRHYRPSDDAFLAMFDAARHIIRLALQDLGPVCIPKTKITVPGCVWPKEYLSALGRAIWRYGVDVEIVLSNPNSIPNGLSPTDANYGNGWSCVDVAAEIIKTIRSQFPEAQDDDLRKKVAENLRVCFIRRPKGSKWDNDKDTIGLHSKHIIIDDTVTYIGSQNLYICDLAEWGVVIDDSATTLKILNSYWKPMWQVSYTGKDVDVQEVMDGLKIDRDGEQVSVLAGAGGLTKEQRMAFALQTGKGKAHDDEEKELYLQDENTDVEEL